MKIYELLAEPEFWTREVLARNDFGESVEVRSPDAMSWCLIGAAERIYGKGTEYEKVRREITTYLLTCLKCVAISTTHWNDQIATHADVITLAKAINR